jgi:uncharacterized protein (TIGR00303 family)
MRPPILFAAAPSRGQALVERWHRQRPSFCCVLAHTDTCLLTGISAAGINEELRPFTPAADAEVVTLGEPRCIPKLPSNPLGAAGPAGITRAALQLAGVPGVFVATGLRVWPDTDCRRVPGEPGGDITRGHAVADVHRLLEAGRELGRDWGAQTRFLVLGESVPGGTTTALTLLLALGYEAAGRVSGSMPGNAHALKQQVACAALEAAGLSVKVGRVDPLLAVTGVGDPMQPLAVGIASAATEAGCDVLLAGGSQMLAVAALLRALYGEAVLERIGIGTTRWVAADPAADISGLASEISPILAVLAANLDFSRSRHAELRAYEQFLVKEGVGAGGACIAALLASGHSIDALEAAIDTTYDGLLGRLALTANDPPYPRRR